MCGDAPRRTECQSNNLTVAQARYTWGAFHVQKGAHRNLREKNRRTGDGQTVAHRPMGIVRCFACRVGDDGIGG